ncbi:uncharacterized protein A4U43_C07F23280 [Asparagus officinalis]|uniref:Uncharacterized protein n=1 Tax=Asparagus officinalis TaxID=4686 RepID=A0A5P1EJH6_ASPOF|nr:uncharacterized protein A4U43_C07F23280 [Asparagus officinalis]
MEDCDVLLLEGLSQPIDESITQPVDSSYYGPAQAQEAQEDVHAQQVTTPKKKVTIATPKKATVSANEKRTPKKATPKRKVTNPSISKKKLTPRRATKLSTSSETLSQEVVTESASLDEMLSAQQQSSPSSDSDDSVEDKNYRIDPRETYVDDDFEEDGLFDEFSNNGKGSKRRLFKRKKTGGSNFRDVDVLSELNNEPRETVNVDGNGSVPEPNNEDKEAVNDSAHSDDSFQAAIFLSGTYMLY